MSAMRPGVLICLFLVGCALRRVDVVMAPTPTPGVFTYDQVGTLTAPKPAYPDYILKSNIEGRNRVSLKFTAGWTAESVRVANSSGNRYLDDSARYAAAGTTFDPAPRARLRTPVYAEIDYSFTRTPDKRLRRLYPNASIKRRGLVEITRVRVWSK